MEVTDLIQELNELQDRMNGIDLMTTKQIIHFIVEQLQQNAMTQIRACDNQDSEVDLPCIYTVPYIDESLKPTIEDGIAEFPSGIYEVTIILI